MINVEIITQKDNFFIPKNVKKIIDLNRKDVTLTGVTLISSDGALNNKKSYFFKGFGFFESFKYGFLLGFQFILDFLDRMAFFKIFNGIKSIKSVCDKHKVTLKEISNPNTCEYIDYLKSKKIGLVISFSAPIVFKGTLLNTPEHGCINLHCSLLPKYSGLMPSFWVLYKNEKSTGVSIHYMDSEIDNGALLNQQMVEIPRKVSIFRLLTLTKNIGGELMCKTISEISHGRVSVEPNSREDGYYYSWPTIGEIRDFRSKGGRFI
ncbi:formyltransferase family protein [Akkermansiaceae bacterium]|nr:formyltransferase family protein [Akkermansiaceae bacterium]